ncbi:MAG: molybdopterin oxidoreductase [Nitrospirae bacterium CG08_land_8_20_14_0_20_52_24]|nr:MAG: molybdopterin oxidoreductase [Nitrospirae bacterium CG08_land_8_20_14_0_20_52_24]
MDEQKHLSVCPHDCPDCCSLLVTVQQGRVVSVDGNPEHPYTRGFICGKMHYLPERIYSPLRIKTPLKRIGKKGEGAFQPISWEEALNEIFERFTGIIRRFGAEAVLPFSYGGTLGLINRNAGHAFFHRLGASRLMRTICSTTAEAGWDYTIGRGISHDPECMVDSDLILLWGINAASTNVHILPLIKEARHKGATLIVIDPYRNKTAKIADIHIRLKPGTDTALALGIMHLLTRNRWIDKDYIERWTYGFDRLEKKLESYPPERVSEITGVPEEHIKDLARRYAHAKAPFIRLGMGMSRQSGGGMAVRTVACLPALVGAFEKRGGGITLMTGSFFELNMEAVGGESLLGDKNPRTINMISLGRALTDLDDPPVQGLFVYHSNPAAVVPNQGLVVKGLMREDLFTVVHEQMHTDTVDYADIVLPATTSLEHADLYKSYGQCYLQWAEPVIPPVGEAKSNHELFSLLSQRFGFDDPFFRRSEDQIAEGLLEPESPFREGIDLQTLKQKRFVRLNVERFGNPFRNGFFTPSGKLEFYSERMKQHGLPPLPEYAPPAEVSEDPSLLKRYPLTLMTPPAHNFLNTSFGSLPSIRSLEKHPTLIIHPTDALSREIQNGEEVRVFNDRGECRLTALVSEETQPGVVVAESIWRPRDMYNHCGINGLTSDREADMGHGPTFHFSLVQVEK